jgi:hypothetical protein
MLLCERRQNVLSRHAAARREGKYVLPAAVFCFMLQAGQTLHNMAAQLEYVTRVSFQRKRPNLMKVWTTRPVENISPVPPNVTAFEIMSHEDYDLLFESDHQIHDEWPVWSFKLLTKEHGCSPTNRADLPNFILRTKIMYQKNMGSEQDSLVAGPLERVEITIEKKPVSCQKCNVLYLKVCGIFEKFEDYIKIIPLCIIGHLHD